MFSIAETFCSISDIGIVNVKNISFTRLLLSLVQSAVEIKRNLQVVARAKSQCYSHAHQDSVPSFEIVHL